MAENKGAFALYRSKKARAIIIAGSANINRSRLILFI